MTRQEQLSIYYQGGLLNEWEYVNRLILIHRVNQRIASIKLQIERPGYKPMTSNELKQREDARRQIATGLKINGAAVKPEYE